MGNQKDNPHIIGLTGSFGSGCSYIAENILKSEPNNYKILSLSKVLKDEYKKESGNDHDRVERCKLQDFGDEKRKNDGAGYFAEQIIAQIKEGGSKDKWVVDSIRNPAEIRALREYSRNFYLFGIYADKERRWGRVLKKYDNNRKAFEDDDKRDKGEDTPEYGQNVSDCFSEADIVAVNDDDFEEIGNEGFEKFKGSFSEYAKLAANPLRNKQTIKLMETFMAMAYAASQRSSCLKRKVGAIIVDGVGNVISSGYNEVPKDKKPCRQKYTKCYRDWLCADFIKTMKTDIPEVKGHEKKLMGIFRKKFKILDYCRALHAEENAILGLVRNGRSVSLKECVLYTTTYPCRLCANKIVEIGIGKVVYLEPYPDEETKAILQDKADAEFFKGVTFRAYFRLYGEEK